MVAVIAVAVAVVRLRQPPRPAYSPPRTPWGEPDLQGTYSSDNSFGVQFQRLQQYGRRATLTDSEFAERAKSGQTPAPAANDADFHEHGSRPSRATSIVVDPPDGRLPALTPDGERRRAERPGYSRQNDAAELHTLFDRCLTRGVVNSILPDIYGNGTRILQGPGYVVIQNEMVHESRVIPTAAAGPRLGSRIHLYMGDPRGRWDGDTLVVDSVNFTGKTDVGGAFVSAGLHLVERLTRTAPDTIHYEFTVDDPATYTAKWAGALDLVAKPGYQIYEYSCHEGNHALTNMLHGARVEEQSSPR